MTITGLPESANVTGRTQALQTRLATERRSCGHGASCLTTAELHLLPMLATHLSGPEIDQAATIPRDARCQPRQPGAVVPRQPPRSRQDLAQGQDTRHDSMGTRATR